MRSPLALFDGVQIPTGATISLPTAFMSWDPANFEGGQKFDGLRWYRQRCQQDDKDMELQFSGVHPSMPVWGLGRSTCPGPFYAELQVKLLLTMFLYEYEIGFPDGQNQRLSRSSQGRVHHPPCDARDDTQA